MSPDIAKVRMHKTPRILLFLLQLNGSLGDFEGIGSFSILPSEDIKKTLPGRSADQRLETEPFSEDIVRCCMSLNQKIIQV